jgi:recombination protein RecA
LPSIVIDSVPSLVPKAEVEGEMGDPQVGRHAKLMSHGIRKLVPIISNSKTVVIFINQIRYNIQTMPGQSPEFTPGGKALKFFCSVRIDIRRIAQIKKGDEVVGGRTRIKVVKNKVAPPYKTNECDILYGEGISHEGEILAMGEKYKIIKTEGNSYYWDELKIGASYGKSRTFLKENPKIMAEIKTLILENFKKVDETSAEVGEIKDEVI